MRRRFPDLVSKQKMQGTVSRPAGCRPGLFSAEKTAPSGLGVRHFLLHFQLS